MHSEVHRSVYEKHAELLQRVVKYEGNYTACFESAKTCACDQNFSDTETSFVMLCGFVSELCETCRSTNYLKKISKASLYNLFVSAVLQNNKNMVNLLTRSGFIDYGGISNFYNIPISFILCLSDGNDHIVCELVNNRVDSLYTSWYDCSFFDVLAIDSSNQTFYSVFTYIMGDKIDHIINLSDSSLEKCNTKRIRWMFFHRIVNVFQFMRLKDSIKLDKNLHDVIITL